jgi:hypothetical protein
LLTDPQVGRRGVTKLACGFTVRFFEPSQPSGSYVVIAGLKRKIAVPSNNNAVQSLLTKNTSLSSKKCFTFNAHRPFQGLDQRD